MNMLALVKNHSGFFRRICCGVRRLTQNIPSELHHTGKGGRGGGLIVPLHWGQEAHLSAFPVITGRVQWLPLHNGFASVSGLMLVTEGGGDGGVDDSQPFILSPELLSTRTLKHCSEAKDNK